MKVTALIMAGGKGKRIGLTVEKPIMPIFGRPLLERIVQAVKSAHKISGFYVITSRNTPETEKICLTSGIKVIRTDGKGYHHDLKQCIVEARLYWPVLIVSSDLPALTGLFLDEIVSTYEKEGKDALRILIPLKRRVELGLSISSVCEHKGDVYAVSGVNMINGAKIFEEKLDEYTFITGDLEAVLNVNTLEDLGIAEKILLRRAKN